MSDLNHLRAVKNVIEHNLKRIERKAATIKKNMVVGKLSTEKGEAQLVALRAEYRAMLPELKAIVAQLKAPVVKCDYVY